MSAFTPELQALAAEVLAAARRAGVRVATAESCTGGLVAALLTEAPGSSDAVDGGFVTYSNALKAAALGVPQALLESHGAVSGPVARAMAEGALARSDAGVTVAITGVAGPGGGSAEKPVGLVWFATVLREGVTREREMRFGDLGRDGVRLAAVRTALEMLQERLA